MIFFEPKRLYNGPFDGDPNKPAIPWSTHAKGSCARGSLQRSDRESRSRACGRRRDDRDLRHAGTRRGSGAKASEIDAEIIDIRSMVPLDIETIATSVKKTGRCVIAHEATRFAGFGAELAATVQEECFWSLEAPIERVAGWDTPYPHAFEWEYFPGQARIARRAAESKGGRMSRYVFKMPDLGEGTVEAEIVACYVKAGDVVKEEQVILEVMTEKATVEVPSPVSGRVVSVTGEPGQTVAVGSEVIVFETSAEVDAKADVASAASSGAPASAARASPSRPLSVAEPARNTRVMASPATRRRAREAGVELTLVSGTGPGGRISRDDFDKFLQERGTGSTEPRRSGPKRTWKRCQ